MDTARMRLTDRPTLFVRTKSTYMPKEAWYNWRRLTGGKNPHHLFLQRNERNQGKKMREDLILYWGRRSEDNAFSIVIYTWNIYTHDIWEWEKKSWKQAASRLEHKANMRALIWLPSLAAVGEGRINNFPNDWQECQGRSPVKTETASLEFISSCPRNTKHTLLFPLLIKAKGINWLLDGSPIILLLSPGKWSWMVQTQLWLR